MPKLSQFFLSACLLAATAEARAEPPVFDYALRGGRDSNLFEDTNRLAGAFVEAEAKLRGAIDIERSTFSYGLWHREKRLMKYRFGDEHSTGLSLGYRTKLVDAVELSVEGSISRDTSGDILIAVPGSVIGYRSTDLAYNFATSLAAEFLGGKNTLTLGLNRLARGKATFTTSLIEKAKLEADVTSLELTANHIRPVFSGELGFTLAYRSTYIPTSEQVMLMRLPASTLRGSIAYGRKIGENLTLVAEFGAVAVMADDLGSNIKRLRPYLHTTAEWQPLERLSLAAGYDQDFAVSGIDDPLGEYTGTLKFAAGLKLTSQIGAKAAYEIASSEWLYYLYHTRTRRLTGTLSYEFTAKHRLELEYRRVDRTEKDPAENFRSDQYFARLAGSF